MNKTTKIILFAVLVIAVVLVMRLMITALTVPAKYEDFAKCLKDEGAIFYGAFWCPHCQSQKKMFGRAQKYLPYVECSTPNGQGQKQLCIDKNVKGYPTWEFADGSRPFSGEATLEQLAEKTSCVLP